MLLCTHCHTCGVEFSTVPMHACSFPTAESYVHRCACSKSPTRQEFTTLETRLNQLEMKVAALTQQPQAHTANPTGRCQHERYLSGARLWVRSETDAIVVQCSLPETHGGKHMYRNEADGTTVKW